MEDRSSKRRRINPVLESVSIEFQRAVNEFKRLETENSAFAQENKRLTARVENLDAALTTKNSELNHTKNTLKMIVADHEAKLDEKDGVMEEMRRRLPVIEEENRILVEFKTRHGNAAGNREKLEGLMEQMKEILSPSAAAVQELNADVSLTALSHPVLFLA
jgi:hypothetical protein